MKSVPCDCFGLDGPILLKASASPCGLFARRNSLWIGGGTAPYGTRAVLATSKGRSRSTIVVEDASNIMDGDVVLALPEQRQLVPMYRAKSEHNTILVTTRCNCRCVMCPQELGPDPAWRHCMNLRLIDMLRSSPPKTLCLTGGEPTFDRDNFLELVQRCSQALPNTALIVLSNGRSFCDEEFSDALASIHHPNLTLGVALYSDVANLHDKVVGARGAFAETVRGLHQLATQRVPVEVRVVILGENHGRLSSIARFITRNLPFADHIALMGMEIRAAAQRNLSTVWVDPVDYQESLLDACQTLNRAGMNLSIYNHPLCVLPRPLWRFACASISDWKVTYEEVCAQCAVRERCGGLFATSTGPSSRGIHPIEQCPSTL